MPFVHPADDLNQTYRVYIPDARRVRVVADAQWIARECQDIANSQRVCPQEFRLEGHQVAVSRGEVNDGLHAQVILNQASQAHTTHAYTSHGAVSDVDTISPGLLHHHCAFEYLGGVQTFGWVKLYADNKLACC